MLLPTTYLAGVLLLVATLVCWGAWGITLKVAGRWRYEHYYFDFAVGTLVGAAIAAFTLGSMNPQELTFSDNFLITGYRKMAWAVAAGGVANLGILLLAAATSVAGLSVAFPIALGVATLFGVLWNLITNPQGNPLLLSGGMLLVAMAVVVVAFAYSAHQDLLVQARKPASPLDPRSRSKIQKPPSGAPGIITSIIGGVFLGGMLPMIQEARSGDNGVAPYGLALLFASGVLASTLVYAPFFINFPIRGEPVQFRDYFKGSKFQHLLGIVGGMMWIGGLLAMLTESTVPVTVAPGQALSTGLREGAPVLAALLGLLGWREFRAGTERVKLLLFFVVLLLILGVTMIGLAPQYAFK